MTVSVYYFVKKKRMMKKELKTVQDDGEKHWPEEKETFALLHASCCLCVYLTCSEANLRSYFRRFY
jgi:hypothetical protein